VMGAQNTSPRLPAGAADHGAVRSAGLQQGAAVAAAEADHDARGVPGDSQSRCMIGRMGQQCAEGGVALRQKHTSETPDELQRRKASVSAERWAALLPVTSTLPISTGMCNQLWNISLQQKIAIWQLREHEQGLATLTHVSARPIFTWTGDNPGAGLRRVLQGCWRLGAQRPPGDRRAAAPRRPARGGSQCRPPLSAVARVPFPCMLSSQTPMGRCTSSCCTW
jgi:hypothetical protein